MSEGAGKCTRGAAAPPPKSLLEPQIPPIFLPPFPPLSPFASPHAPPPTSQGLKDTKWTKKKWAGPLQYEDPSGKLMMLPTDMVLIWDKKFKK